jgi:predicted ester cyclase
MLYEVIVGGNLALMDELVAPDFINHNVVGTGEASHAVGVENFRQEILALRSALSDIVIDEIHLLADGDYVIAHIRSRGSNTGEFAGIPPTGKLV